MVSKLVDKKIRVFKCKWTPVPGKHRHSLTQSEYIKLHMSIIFVMLGLVQ